MDLVTNFYRYLEGLEATTDQLERQAQRLRYEVYCVERGFEDPKNFPDKLEKDEYDNRSLHAIVRHRTTGYPAGVVRLILPDQNDVTTPFPVELHCGDLLDQQVIKQFDVNRAHLAEVSRFAVSKNFKRRPGEEGTVAGVSSTLDYEERKLLEDSRRIFPHISLGLIAMLFVMSQKHDVTHWYAVMEPSLSRLLTRFGINFTPLGPVVDYHGQRQPMMARPEQLLENIRRKRPDFAALIESLSGIETAIPERMPRTAHG